MVNYKAAIFDMDGVIVDNHTYHVEAWANFCQKHNIPFSEQTFRSKYFGKSNQDIFTEMIDPELSQNVIFELAEEKEAIYREIYKDHIQSISGLVQFITKLRSQGIKTAVATSAPASNLNFVLDTLNIRHLFDAIVDSTMVRNCKPDPEIYIKASTLLNTDPKDCVVFEDSIAGIQSAHSAGMQVIALITTHKAEELPKTFGQIHNYDQILNGAL